MNVEIYYARQGHSLPNVPIFVMPLDRCVAEFDMRVGDWRCALGRPPKFGTVSRLDGYIGPCCAVAAIDEALSKSSGWPAGYYSLRLSPNEIHARLTP
jgi:hypothetical protein